MSENKTTLIWHKVAEADEVAEGRRILDRTLARAPRDLDVLLLEA